MQVMDERTTLEEGKTGLWIEYTFVCDLLKLFFIQSSYS